MFKKIFDRFKKKPSEAQLDLHPRRVPAIAIDADENGLGWIVTREFVPLDKPTSRLYFGAVYDGQRNVWQISRYTYDLMDQDERLETTGVSSVAAGPARVIQYLRDQEEKQKILKARPVTGSQDTWHRFANKLGLHFDDKGELFAVDKDKPMMETATIDLQGLQDAYRKVAQRQGKVSTWNEVYENIVRNMPEGIRAEDLAADPAFTDFSRQSRGMIEKLSKLPEFLLNPSVAEREKQLTLQQIMQVVIVDPTGFSSREKGLAALHMVDSTVLVGLLRAGVELYRKQFSDLGSFDKGRVQMIKEIGNTCVMIAQRRFGIPQGEAEKIANVITQGADPVASELPLGELLKRQTATPAPQAVQPKPN